MTSRDFCYWLQGYFEILGATSTRDANEGSLTAGQCESIKKHLAMVFKHEIDPAMGSLGHQAELSATHQGGGSAAEPPKPQTHSTPSSSSYEELSPGWKTRPPGARC